MKFKIFAVGGTIDKIYFDRKDTYHVGEPTVSGILEESGAVFDYEVESLIKKDSLEMTLEDRRQLAERISKDSCSRVLVTHGTDTMVETARLLKDEVKGKGKTIVLTGAMLPARFKVSDAAFNVGFAMAALQLLGKGVYIAMNGQIFDPDKVVKNIVQGRFEEKGP